MTKKKVKNYNKNLSTSDLYEIICYNLAQFSHLEQRYRTVQGITDFDSLVDIMATRIQDEAQRRKEKIQNFVHLKNNTSNPLQRQRYDDLIARLRLFPYNIEQIVNNKSLAKHQTKSIILLGDFEIVLADQQKEARYFDSAGRTGLINSNNELYKTHFSHYREINSVGPVIENISLDQQAIQQPVNLFLSKIKPNKKVNHQIWINDHLMIRLKVPTTLSLNDYLSQSSKKIADLFYMISYAEKIEKSSPTPLTQAYIQEEEKKLRMNHTKRLGENYLEQYGILTVEVLGQLIKKLKHGIKQAQNSALYDDLNLIPTLNHPFSNDDTDQMKQYLTMRDNLAHPTEYNFRAFGIHSKNIRQQSILRTFVSDMTAFLANFMNMNVQDVEKKISSIPMDEIFDVRSLILLMDTRKALRDICIKEGNLSENQENVFLHLKMISKEENDILIDAIELRNQLCHSRIDSTLAREAERLSGETWDIINKISTEVGKRYNVSLEDYFQQSTTQMATNAQELHAIFPFLNTDFETDPDYDLFQKAFQEKQKTQSTPLDRKVLLDLYAFSFAIHNHVMDTKGFQNHPYNETEMLPYIQEMDAYVQKNPDPKGKLKEIIVHGALSAWVKGHILPTLKTQNSKN